FQEKVSAVEFDNFERDLYKLYLKFIDERVKAKISSEHFNSKEMSLDINLNISYNFRNQDSLPAKYLAEGPA
ncbi:MAG: hypothetical protein OXU45_05990, partial [Candidatus Melainabacteria bacterium]|nr:hypothetical protein [Candidatus Melainabacteria bacterium]